jgi:adenosylcobinamide-phosphate synthase
MWAFPAFAAAALALFIERLAGYPTYLLDRIGHPVIWVGRLISWLDAHLNRNILSPADGRLRGVIALVVIIAAALIPAWFISHLLGLWRNGWAIEALLATSLIAQKSMRDHVLAVNRGLSSSLAEGRRAVAHIVGRDPARLDESGVSRAALESLAENTSDGVVAPVFWFALLGLPGIAVYKAVNTADSMIGHKSERHLHFGWAAARFDDLINLPCSRLTGFLFAASQGRRFGDIIDVMRRDAPKHQSPNAGWPEAAMAAALEIRLGGPRFYDGERLDLPWMGDGRSDLNRTDIRRGLKVYGRAMTLLLIALVLLSLVF